MSFHVIRARRARPQHPAAYSGCTSGFRRFQHRWYHPDETLVPVPCSEGQHPLALVIACCDSRVDPVLLTDCRPGDLFVVRQRGQSRAALRSATAAGTA